MLFLIRIESVHAQMSSLQQQIDNAKPGDTIDISSGMYEEHLRIHKPVHLIGQGEVTLTQKDHKPIITIDADDVKIENLNLQYTMEGNEEAAVAVYGDRNILHRLVIRTNRFGIRLDQANDNVLSHLTIAGDENEQINLREHGILLQSSHQNEIQHTQIMHVKDGIYLDKSNNTRLLHNTVQQSRYGYHLMFTNNTLLEENTADNNVNGMMIMGTSGTEVIGNTLLRNQRNPQSIGLFLYDVKDATVKHNQIEYNRIGIFIDNASRNELFLNEVTGNYVGIQLRNAVANTLQDNSFIANVTQGLADRSADNEIDGNYWGDHLGLDMTGSGTSDIAYVVDPFFLHITNGYPAFQLLFQSPGMNFLRQLIQIPIEQQLIDYSPLLDNPINFQVGKVGSNQSVLWFSMSLLVISIFTMYMGVKKR